MINKNNLSCSLPFIRGTEREVNQPRLLLHLRPSLFIYNYFIIIYFYSIVLIPYYFDDADAFLLQHIYYIKLLTYFVAVLLMQTQQPDREINKHDMYMYYLLFAQLVLFFFCELFLASRLVSVF